MSSERTPEILKENGITVISLGSEYENLDENGLEDLSEVILHTAQTAEPPLVVIDLSHTKFFGSGFIEILFRAWNRLSGREGGRLCICGLTEYCREVIDVTHLDRLWDVCETREDAVQALSP